MDDRAAGGAGPDEGAWAAAAASALRRAGRLAADAPDSAAWDRLARSTVEGLRVPPLGTAARAAALPTARALAAEPGTAPFLRGSAPAAGADAGWDVRALISDPDPAQAHRSAMADLEGGVTSLWIRVGDGATDPGDLADVLAGVHLDMAPVVLSGDRPDVDLAAARALRDLARGRGVTLHPDGNLGADPIGRLASAGLFGDGSGRSGASSDHAAAGAFRSVADFVSLATDLGVRAIVVDGTVAHDAGAGDAAEVGYTLAAGAACLRALVDAGLDVDTACGLVDVRYAATDDQFATIAKLRAARLAWHRMCELSGATPAARAQRQHAVTSAAMLTRYDPWVNMLRATVAAFAAGVGGATAVTALPFDTALGIPEEFGRRMARNVSALLLGEAHVGAVADPAGGAYAVEMLTADLAAAAWAEFGRIEAAGGALAALADGSLARRVAATREERDRRIATRRQPITGVSEFPDPTEDLPTRRPGRSDPRVRRWAEPFERLRERPSRGPVLLVTVGPAGAASARLLFTRNLLAAGGITVTEPEAGTGQGAGFAAAAAAAGAGADVSTGADMSTGAEVTSGADVTSAAAVTWVAGHRPVVMLAGSDAAYAASLRDVAQRLRAAGARAVLLAGRPTEVLAGLPAGLIDKAIAAGDDVLDFVRAVRAHLEGEK